MSLGRVVKELFFPRWCCGCNKYGELLCPKCFSLLQFNGEVITNGESLTSVSSLLTLEPISLSLIHQLKYKSVREIAVLCARMMFLYGTVPHADILTAIPLHPHRLNSRGFNQAEEIANELSKLLHIPSIPLLIRVKNIANLASTADIQERKTLIKKQFKIIRYSTKFTKKNIVIIDDVWTSGSTIEEAAQTLKALEPLQIHGYTFAHGR